MLTCKLNAKYSRLLQKIVHQPAYAVYVGKVQPAATEDCAETNQPGRRSHSIPWFALFAARGEAKRQSQKKQKTFQIARYSRKNFLDKVHKLRYFSLATFVCKTWQLDVFL